MKNFIFYVLVILFTASPTFAQKKNTKVDQKIERILAEIEQKPNAQQNLKSYYADRNTAETCEAWTSCAHWAFEQYTKDQSFKITQAHFKVTTQHGRHSVSKQKVLQVRATSSSDTLTVIFLTPHYVRGRPSFRYTKRSSK